MNLSSTCDKDGDSVTGELRSRCSNVAAAARHLAAFTRHLQFHATTLLIVFPRAIFHTTLEQH